jgi:hypothetical protein
MEEGLDRFEEGIDETSSCNKKTLRQRARGVLTLGGGKGSGGERGRPKERLERGGTWGKRHWGFQSKGGRREDFSTCLNPKNYGKRL